jgi:hypothetical protein
MTLRRLNSAVFVFDDVLPDGAIAGIPVRTTVIQHKSTLVLYSPLSMPESVLKPLLVNVTDVVLIAPNAAHHMFAHVMLNRCRDLGVDRVRLISSPALHARFPDRDWGTVVTRSDSDAPLDVLGDGALSLFLVRGLTLDELVLFVSGAQLLCCCDLAFNLAAHHVASKPLWMRLYVAAIPRASLSLPFFFFIRDAPAMCASLERLLQLDFSTLTMAHGDVITDDAKAALRNGTAQFAANVVTVRQVARRAAIVALVIGGVMVARRFV